MKKKTSVAAWQIRKRLLSGKTYVDLILRPASTWIGVHYSSKHDSYCVALIPGVVFRIGKTKYITD